MNKGLILAAALLTAFSFSVQAQQCSDEEMKKVMSEASNDKKLDEINQKKFDEKIVALAKLKHWSDSQRTSYALKIMETHSGFGTAHDPFALSMDMLKAIQKKDCKKVAEINKKSVDVNKKMWTSLFKKIDDDIAAMK